MVYHDLPMVEPWFDHDQPLTLNGTNSTMVDHGQKRHEKDMVNHV